MAWPAFVVDNSYDEGAETYEIEWDFKRGKGGAEARKSVRRSNLLLQGEDERTLELDQERRERQVRGVRSCGRRVCARLRWHTCVRECVCRRARA